MSRNTTSAGLLVLFLPLATAAVAQLDMETEYQALRDAYAETEAPAEKLTLVQNYLAKYPDSERAPRVLRSATYLLREEMNDHTGAVDYTKEILAKVEDPETIGAIRLVLVGLYDAPAYAKELQAIAIEMAEAGQQSFANYLSLIRSATGAAEWAMVQDLCQTAHPLANATTFQADFPDRDFTEADLQKAGKNRKGLLGTYKGWALARSGNTDEALRTFAESEGLVRFNYLGVPENDLYLYWGQTLLETREYDAALMGLSKAAIWGYSEDALAAARRAYIAKNGNENGFDEFLWSVRQEHAKTIDNFTLVNYQDQKQSLSDLKGKVTLVTFWFPT
jgi:hypothetical protein